jgi:hypothetical protein
MEPKDPYALRKSTAAEHYPEIAESGPYNHTQFL